jgi:TonB family protein
VQRLVNLTSSPSGAMVLVHGRSYGPTPAQVELSLESSELDHELAFVFEKPGFESTRVTRLVHGGDLSVDVQLEREQAGRRARSQRSSDHAPAAATSVAELQTPSLPSTAEVPAPSATHGGPVAPSELPRIASQPAAAPAVVSPARMPQAAPQTASPSVRLPGGAAPEYPRSARRAGVSGSVVARVFVKSDGSVGGVEIVEGPAVFHQAVMSALLTWHYKPARQVNGNAVPDTHVVRIPFALE